MNDRGYLTHPRAAHRPAFGVGKNERETAITAGEGLKLGVLVFGLLRAIASLGDD